MWRRTTGGTPHRTVPLLAALVAAIALQLFTTSPAMAHARLVSSYPAGGARLDRLPEFVKLEFSESVRLPAALTVTAPDGEEISAETALVAGTTLSRPLDKSTEAPEGVYTISYQVTAGDGHLNSGIVRFTLSGLRATPTPDQTSSDEAIRGPAPLNGTLMSSSPAEGATLRFLPEVAVLNFNKLVRLPATVTVTGPDRDEISTADASVQDATLFRPLDATELRDGSYIMSYRVTAADGQSISGTVRFTLARAPVAATAESSSGTRSPPVPTFGLTVGLVAALGLAVFTIRQLMRHGLVVAFGPVDTTEDFQPGPPRLRKPRSLRRGPIDRAPARDTPQADNRL